MLNKLSLMSAALEPIAFMAGPDSEWRGNFFCGRNYRARLAAISILRPVLSKIQPSSGVRSNFSVPAPTKKDFLKVT